MDVKTAFLHGSLEEDLYMYQPEGYEDPEKKDHVCLLKKSYGLKQSPRQWNRRFDQFMKSRRFVRSEHDQYVYTREDSNKGAVYLLLYVDDMLIASKSMSEVEKLKAELSSEFEMKDLGTARKILGMDIFRDRSSGEGHYVRGRSEKRNIGSGKDRNRFRSKSKEGKRVCWIYGKEGHYKKQCYKWIERNKGQQRGSERGEAASARDDAKDLVGLLVAEVNVSSSSSDHDEWILDTGCTFHMTPKERRVHKP